MKRIFRYLLAFLLLLVMATIISTTILRYNITPQEIYLISPENLIDDGGFENFNKTAGDCCNSDPNASKVYASRSADTFEGKYSLNLTSENHCSCINKNILNFSNSELYWLTFYYKGDNPKVCNWITGDNKCDPLEELNWTDEFTLAYYLLAFTEKSESSRIYFYADNREGIGTVTNLYDDLQVHRLIPIESPSTFDYQDNESYIILTKADNIVHNGELLKEVEEGEDAGMAYFLVYGKPNVTIKFPITEIVIVVLIIVIIIRLLFTKQVLKAEKEIEEKVEKGVDAELRALEKELKLVYKKIVELRKKKVDEIAKKAKESESERAKKIDGEIDKLRKKEEKYKGGRYSEYYREKNENQEKDK